MNSDQLQSIAAALEDGYGSCPHGRAATMELGLSYGAWLGEE